MLKIAAAFLGCVLSGVVVCQTASRPLSFDVASVKRYAEPVVVRGTTSESDSNVTYTHTTLLRLVMRAYDVQYFQVKGPTWFTTEYYDVSAKLPENAKKDQIPTMLQELLSTRFGLKLHHEAKDTPVYVLTAPEGAAKLKPCEAEQCQHQFIAHARNGPTQLQANTLKELSIQLSGVIGRPVVNSTAIVGTYNIVTPEFIPSPEIESDSSGLPSVFTALKTLGMKLEPGRAPVDNLVIDAAEKMPTPN